MYNKLIILYLIVLIVFGGCKSRSSEDNYGKIDFTQKEIYYNFDNLNNLINLHNVEYCSYIVHSGTDRLTIGPNDIEIYSILKCNNDTTNNIENRYNFIPISKNFLSNNDKNFLNYISTNFLGDIDFNWQYSEEFENDVNADKSKIVKLIYDLNNHYIYAFISTT